MEAARAVCPVFWCKTVAVVVNRDAHESKDTQAC